MDNAARMAIHDRLERIREREGGILRPEDVVKDARNSTSPLHAHFNWDDAEAAHQHRLDQARALIARVRVEVQTSTRRMAVPYYIRDPNVGHDEQGYSPMATIRNERQSAEDALRYEFDRAVALLERTVGIAEALDIEESFVDLLCRARVIRETVLAAPVQEQPAQRKGRKSRTAVAV